MTGTAVGRPRPAAYERALAALRDRGLRASTARGLVLRVLSEAGAPVTVARVASGLDGLLPRSDLASVYRILDTLEAARLVHRVHLGPGPARYELDDGCEREYLLCEGCGATRSVDPAALDDVRRQLRARFGLTPRFTSFPLAGLCDRCASVRPPARRRP